MRADTESKTEFQSTGGKFSRKFAKKDVHPFDELNWMKRDCTIANPDGSVVFSLKDIEVPTTWGQLSFDIAVSKYFKRAGIPKTGHEISVKQLVYRVAHTYRVKGEQFGYFNSKTDADAFEEDLTFLLVNQFAAFNSPVWFNVGLNEVHGIKGKADNYHYFPEKQKVERVDTYEFPQCSACFIQSLTDDLDSIFELIKNESRLFKYGSGTGTNFSKLRGKGEKLSGGGSSSGLISFLEVLDRGAGATKSGGITRRAAKMVMLDMDHPDIEEFITWKTREEDKALALIRAGYSSDFNGEAYKTVSGQNSNNSVRIPHKFMEAYLNNSKWQTFFRTNNQLAKEYDAKYLMDQIAHSAWRCADPGVQFDDTMNEWHTCPNNDKIRATNPCVTGDTLVLTKNNGWQRIDSLINKETEIVTNLNEMSIGLTNGSFETGIKPVYKLTTNSGYELKLTADHKVFTANRGFVEAIELTKDDFVCIPSTQVNAIIEPKEKEFFQLLGVYLGDGSGSGGVIQITMDKAEENILQTIAAYCSTAFEKQTYQNRGTMVVQTATSSKINIASSKAIERISQFVDLTQKSFEKTISEKIFSLSLGEQKYILQGLFTTDGTVANYGEKSQYVALDSTSHELIKGVQLMLLGFGIKSKIYSNRRAGKLTSMLPDGKGGIKEYNVKEMHSLRISRSSRILFQQLIGFMQESNKNNQLAELNSSISTYEDKPFDAVKSLEYIGEKKVYDLTEMFSHSFIANGISVHNCSEYVFIDDTACNLASLNLMKYLKEDGIFDVESFRNAIKIIFTAQEISVAMSSFPTESIAKNSYDYRTIGLGYANLGTMLMVSGIPYDSDKGRAIAGAITAIMTGHAYKVSAEIAEKVGSFTHFEKNREPMLKVMNKHRDEAYKIDETLCPKYLIKAAEEDWDNAVLLGEKFGYRNAQATVLAPTGTIGLLMDCDTTGVEPEFAIVKWKKLAGGGYFKIVNQSILLALQRLEYNDIQIKEMLDYVLGFGTFDGCPFVNPESLKSMGFTEQQIIEATKYIETMKALDDWTPHINLKSLAAKGLSKEQIKAAKIFIEGAQTFEGAPHVLQEHLAVFDCANKCGIGERFIAPMGHIKIMAAVQPFISGAISKTVNIPNSATVDDIKNIYVDAWKLGLKCVALYRDGCKSSQPLSTSSSDRVEEKEAKVIAAYSGLKRGEKKELAYKRHGYTTRTMIGGNKVFVRTGEYPDGTLGEIFLDMHKEGAAFRGLLGCFSIAISYGLQYGVPLEKYVDAFTFTRFEPSGRTDHPYVKSSTSIVDFVFRVIALDYLGRTDLAHVKPEVLADTAGIKLDYATIKKEFKEPKPKEVSSADALNKQMGSLMGDAPPCDNCGHITVRNGSCYKCLNCGSSMGCS